MFTTYPRFTRKHLLAASSALIAIALALPFTAEYRPLGERMAQRYAENLDRTAAAAQAKAAQAAADQRQRDEATRQFEQQRQEAARQRAAAEARARDEARATADRQRAAEEEAQRAASGFDRDTAEFLRILRIKRPPVVATVANTAKALDQLTADARRTGFYDAAGIRPEDASRRACTDPAGTLDLLHRDARRSGNILACAVYMALRRAENPEPAPQVMVALLHRVHSDEEAGHYPLQTLVSYVWMPHLYAAAVAGQPPGPFPELNSGEAINPALLRGVIPPSFARRLIETGTTEEKLELVTHAYPDLRRMAELGARIAHACQVMKRVPCLTPN